jgi:hypothetical protein
MSERPADSMWFVDGYHNGPYYGIPPGSWRDIADALERRPSWKLVLDVEPTPGWNSTVMIHCNCTNKATMKCSKS